jgi:hypothetical protein
MKKWLVYIGMLWVIFSYTHLVIPTESLQPGGHSTPGLFALEAGAMTTMPRRLINNYYIQLSSHFREKSRPRFLHNSEESE